MPSRVRTAHHSDHPLDGRCTSSPSPACTDRRRRATEPARSVFVCLCAELHPEPLHRFEPSGAADPIVRLGMARCLSDRCAGRLTSTRRRPICARSRSHARCKPCRALCGVGDARQSARLTGEAFGSDARSGNGGVCGRRRAVGAGSALIDYSTHEYLRVDKVRQQHNRLSLRRLGCAVRPLTAITCDTCNGLRPSCSLARIRTDAALSRAQRSGMGRRTDCRMNSAV